LAAIRKLKAQGRYRLFLFSNTNLIHLQAIYKQHGEKVFQDCFEEEFYSFILRQKKPEPRAFLSILARHGLKAAETIHVDDALEHIQGAEAAGLQALQVVPKSEKPFGSAVVNSVLAAINWIETRNRSFHAVDNKASSSVGAFALAEEAPEKKSWFSCCSCLFKSKKKEKQPLVEEQYQYFPSDDYSVSL
jgi:FMN phosphatase YigB (HAD superfamily)